MDTKRLALFLIFSFSLIYLWQQWQVSHAPAPTAQTQSGTGTSDTGMSAPGSTANTAAGGAPVQDVSQLARGNRIRVTTDVLQVELDSAGGDIRTAYLLKHGAVHHPEKPFQLLDEGRQHLYVAQTGLTGHDLPTHTYQFTAQPGDLKMIDGQNEIAVDFTATTPSGIEVVKRLIFKRGSYVVNVKYDIVNRTAAPIQPRAYFRLLRDSSEPEKESSMIHTFTGPVYFTEQDKFHKLDFEDLAENKEEYNRHPKDGWVGFVQHYFTSVWLLNQPPAQDGQIKSVCKTHGCQLEIKKLEKPLIAGGKTFDDVYSAAVAVNVGAIPPGQTGSVSMPLFVGPEDSKIFDQSPVKELAPELKLTKDYGWVTFLASPLFWVLQQIHKFIPNWGWAIVVLTIFIKAVLWPLSAASYKSMANMKKVAPKLQAIKEQHGDDRMKYQQAMMELYKTEKINPLGGCLPILLQIPVFFALYSMLLASVELRQAPFVLWIEDLSLADPYFVLPVLMAVTMYAQTLLNPPPSDPMQAKMMKIMPIAFSVMFFFFPVGLVIYYLVNNLLSIAQQYWANKKYG